MPVVTVTKNEKTTYVSVTAADECRLDAVVSEYGLDEHGTREGAEHRLKTYYLEKLTQHAHDCAVLAHLITTEPEHPDDEAPVNWIGTRDEIAQRVARDAIWLRTFEPFAGLTADVDMRSEYGTGMKIGAEVVSSLDNDSWDATSNALRLDSPMWRARRAADAAEEAGRQAVADRVRKSGIVKKLDRIVNGKKTIANKRVKRGAR